MVCKVHNSPVPASIFPNPPPQRPQESLFNVLATATAKLTPFLYISPSPPGGLGRGLATKARALRGAGQVLKERLPALFNCVSHLGPIPRQNIDLGDRAHDAVGFVSDASHRVVEQFLHHIRRHLHFREHGGEGPAQIVERPSLDSIPQVLLVLTPARDRPLVRDGRREQKIGAVPARDGVEDGRRHISVGEGVLPTVFRDPLGQRD